MWPFEKRAPMGKEFIKAGSKAQVTCRRAQEKTRWEREVDLHLASFVEHAHRFGTAFPDERIESIDSVIERFIQDR